MLYKKGLPYYQSIDIMCFDKTSYLVPSNFLLFSTVFTFMFVFMTELTSEKLDGFPGASDDL